jgi:NADH-quinone oxidoreductase subunit L
VACGAAVLAFAWTALTARCLGSPDPEPLQVTYADWFGAGGFSCSFGLYFDRLSCAMALVVTGVSALIHIYSLGYMARDPGYQRYFSYLNLFLAAMLILVLGDNLVLIFVGWEGVGLCSYLLIGFWYEDAAKAEAGVKAFVFNRIGDLGFILGIFVLFAIFGTVNLAGRMAPQEETDLMAIYNKGERYVLVAVLRGDETHLCLVRDPGLLDCARVLPDAVEVAGHPLDEKGVPAAGIKETLAPRLLPGWTLGAAITLACLLLLGGAIGKSAQLPLYAWLPDAMAGPTPVSALIHAATMVTAGVYMIARLGPLFSLSPAALLVIATVGALTAIFAALVALTQTDIKKVLAYSTISQLGFMFLAAGTGCYGLAMFHVVTHAFFKALLFLGAGSVIHALGGEQDLTRMGGLRRRMPLTFWTMLAGALALAGFPLTAGWYSKDALLGAVLWRGAEDSLFLALYAVGIVAAFCTAFYAFRLMGLTFFGPCRAGAERDAHVHEAPAVMTWPCAVLAVGALLGGWLLAQQVPLLLGPALSPEDAERGHLLTLVLGTIAALGGMALAIFLYIKPRLLPRPQESRNALVKLSFRGFFLDDLYMRVFTRVFALAAEVLHLLVDVLLIDTLLVNGAGFAARLCGRGLQLLHRGLVNAYAAGVLAGVLALLYWLLR